MERKDVLSDVREAFTAGLAKAGTDTAAQRAFQASIDHLTGELTPVPQETALMADTFVRRLSVNSHLSWRSTVWGQNPAWKKLFAGLGVYTTRTTMSLDPACYADLEELGVKLDCPLMPTDAKGNYDRGKAKAIIDKIAALVPEQLLAFEGPNEPNNGNPAGWDARVRDYQAWLFDTVHAHPVLGDRVVAAPAIWGRETAAIKKLGPVPCDVGNLHYYTGARPPPIAGFPSSYDQTGDADKTYGLDDAIREALMHYPDKKLWITETGWAVLGPGLQSSPWYCTPQSQAKYTVRMLCDSYIRPDVEQVSVYSLLDDDRDPPRYHGLCTIDLVPRPAYNGMKRVVRLLRDPGPDFAPEPTDLKVQMPASVKRLPLFQRRDGGKYLGFWQDMAVSYNRETQQDVPVPTQSVQIDFGKLTQFRVLWPTLKSEPVYEGTASGFNLDVPDELALVEFF